MTNQKNSLQSAKTSKRKGICGCFDRICCHLKAAIFVASCVVILEHGHWLEGLDIATYQLAVPQLFKAPPKLPEDYIKKFGSAKVITINDKLYETKFKQSSPLDRSELYDIVNQILNSENKPKVLAVDLDLSPEPKEITDGETQQYNVGENELYSLLRQAKDTEIVLITPVKVYSDDLIDKKVQWIEYMLEKDHIHFGLPYLYSVKGVVLKYLSDSNSFANQIKRAAKNGKSDSLKEVHSIRCYKGKQLNRFVSAKASTGVSTELKELNYKFLDSVEPIRIADNGLVGDITNKQTESVVLLGGSYGPTDKYETPVGTLAGVFLHAASYYSVANPVDVYHVRNYFMEIGVSTLLGAVFCLFARWFWNTRSLLTIIINLVFQLLFMYTFIYLAGILLSFNWWIHPASLIIGMEIHALYCILERKIKKNFDCVISFINKYFKCGIAIIEKIPCVKYDSLPKNIKCFFYCGIVITSWLFIAEGFFKH